MVLFESNQENRGDCCEFYPGAEGKLAPRIQDRAGDCYVICSPELSPFKVSLTHRGSDLCRPRDICLFLGVVSRSFLKGCFWACAGRRSPFKVPETLLWGSTQASAPPKEPQADLFASHQPFSSCPLPSPNICHSTFCLWTSGASKRNRAVSLTHPVPSLPGNWFSLNFR